MPVEICRKFEIKTGTVVMNSFFLNIAEPEKWLSDEVIFIFVSSSRILFFVSYEESFATNLFVYNNVIQHMHVIMEMLWMRRGQVLKKKTDDHF